MARAYSDRGNVKLEETETALLWERAHQETHCVRHLLIAAALLALPAAAIADRPNRGADPNTGMPPGMGASPEAVAAAARPGDEQMTCEQIGAEMQPYAMQMQGNMQGHNIEQDMRDVQAANEAGQRRAQQQMAPSMIAGMLSGLVPGGGYAATAAAQAQEAENERQIAAQRPLQDRMTHDMNGMAADTSSQMAGNPRIQRLMQLAQEKHCH